MIEPPLPEAPSERPQEYVAEESFEDFGMSAELRRAIADRGYTNPTPVQAQAFKPAIEGKDLIVRSKTGTGKTAAFGMPLIERIPMGTRGVRALILCPTRELALQVNQELAALAKYRDITTCAIYGGAPMKAQEDALKAGAAIVVGTPGRVYDHIRRGNLKLDGARHAVLDEADEMLNQGFYEEVTRILDCFPKDRQVLLFSATVPADIQRLIAKYTTDAQTLLLSGDVYTVDHIHHVRYDLSDAYPKPRNLLYMLELEEPENAIIFCNTRSDTELVTAVLNRNGLDAELLNGDLPQKERERVMAKVKRGEVEYMVATDLAARGIDISDLSHVINYSLPEDPAVYLHRVGRTGRIGKKGVGLNLVSGRELSTLTALEKKYSIVFEKREMPSPEKAQGMWTERHVADIKEAAKGSIYEGYLALAKTLKGRDDADELIAVLLRYFYSHRRMERLAQQAAEGDAPSEERLSKGGGRHGDRERGPRRDRDDRGGRREGRRDRDDRGGRREGRRDREEREARPPRDEENTVPTGTAAREPDATVSDDTARTPAVERADTERTPAAEAADTERRPAVQRRERGERRERSDRAPGAGGARSKLSDRELFELMQSGKPLPPIDDPTTRAADEGEGESSEEPRREGRRERGGRDRDRGRRERTPLPSVEAGEARLWVNLGRMDGVDDAGVSGALEAAGAPSGGVKRVELRGSHSYVIVDESNVGAFEGLSGKAHGDKALKLEKAKHQ